MPYRQKIAFLICLTASYATAVHGADPWDEGDFGSHSSPWNPSAASDKYYPEGTGGQPGAPGVSPFEAFRPPAGAESGRAGSRLPSWEPAPSSRGSESAASPSAGALQADLSGNWRGSAGEYVEIRGNQARIWEGRERSCFCVFMVYGNHMIAYSPDTDVVKKFEYSGRGDYFRLRDERGGVMTFRRAR